VRRAKDTAVAREVGVIRRETRRALAGCWRLVHACRGRWAAESSQSVFDELLHLCEHDELADRLDLRWHYAMLRAEGLKTLPSSVLGATAAAPSQAYVAAVACGDAVWYPAALCHLAQSIHDHREPQDYKFDCPAEHDCIRASLLRACMEAVVGTMAQTEDARERLEEWLHKRMPLLIRSRYLGAFRRVRGLHWETLIEAAFSYAGDVFPSPTAEVWDFVWVCRGREHHCLIPFQVKAGSAPSISDRAMRAMTNHQEGYTNDDPRRGAVLVVRIDDGEDIIRGPVGVEVWTPSEIQMGSYSSGSYRLAGPCRTKLTLKLDPRKGLVLEDIDELRETASCKRCKGSQPT
jgi:hypothetical protein